MSFLCLLTALVGGMLRTAVSCKSREILVPDLKGLMIAGGMPSFSGGKSVEVFVPSTGQHCQLPDLPAGRFQHSMDARTVCGGRYTWTSCITLTQEGTWERTTTLLEKRFWHSSWASPSGLILLGGVGSRNTSEKIPAGTSSSSFNLKYNTNRACAINLGSSVILTGGKASPTKVSEYNEAGWVSRLPSLLQGRRDHGCSYYNNADGTKTFLVSGGYSGHARLSSTELLLETASTWVLTGELPSPRYGLRGANIDNKILMTGGGYYDRSYTFFDEILEFDLLTGQWKLVDRMIRARGDHAVSVIKFDSGLCV